MRRTKIYFIFILFILMTGCIFPQRITRIIGSGEMTSEMRKVSGFDSVQLNGIGTLIIEQGNSESLEIVAEENIIPYLESQVVGNDLHLEVQDFIDLEPTSDIIYYLSVKDLEKIEISGLGELRIEGLKTNKLNFKISGSGNANIEELVADSFMLEISGLGNVKAAGKVESQKAELSGAGLYDAENLRSDSAKIKISGTGKAVVWVNDYLDIEQSGIGGTQYYGNPSLKTEISGMGSVEAMGNK